MVHVLTATNDRISRSALHHQANGPDWTRPAERPERTFREIPG